MNRVNVVGGACLACAVMSTLPAYAETAASKQAQAGGFFEEDSLTFSTRNWYAREAAKNSSAFAIRKDWGVERTHDRNTWVQGSILKYSSGYTQGPVGFGLDVAAFNALALESGKGAVAGGRNRTLTEDDGDVVANWSKVGIADIRMRVSNTELKAGRFNVRNPVMSFSDTRALPATYEGFALTSEEFRNLYIQVGSFDRASPRVGAGSEKLRTQYTLADITSDRVSFAGFDYKPWAGGQYSAWYSNLEDIWDRYYLGASQEFGDGPLRHRLAANYYFTEDSGSVKGGPIDNHAYSLAFTSMYQGHSVTLAWQQIDGDEYFDYVRDSNAINLANALVSEYNGPNEKSLRLTYGYDWTTQGVPGLTTTVWYAKGWDIDGTHYRGGAGGLYEFGLGQKDLDHHEVAGMLSYAVQSGPIKGANFTAGYVQHRASQNQGDGSFNELRIVSNFPFKLF
ncbi:outer membrane porin, OprD family [Pseudomonas linyingensis]|uniref:Outer membrane porin, OprD family n=2 Tax=Pseudomonas linyingensis TaxID=915471 RepID=A0A1H7A1D5_9PSED|nr:outer membrane porin, OprD family [Pseudomonas linyingensis]